MISLVTNYGSWVQRPSFPNLFIRHALHWPEGNFQPLWWTKPSPPVNSEKKGPLHLMPFAALHSRLFHWRPDPNALPLRSAIIPTPWTSPLEGTGVQHRPRCQVWRPLSKLSPHSDTPWCCQQTHRNDPEGKISLQKFFSTSQAKSACIVLFLSALQLNANSTGIRFT